MNTLLLLLLLLLLQASCGTQWGLAAASCTPAGVASDSTRSAAPASHPVLCLFLFLLTRTSNIPLPRTLCPPDTTPPPLRFCFFDKATQVDNGGGHETSLGLWKGFENGGAEVGVGVSVSASVWVGWLNWIGVESDELAVPASCGQRPSAPHRARPHCAHTNPPGCV
jgi:hypothetical protein